MVDVDHFKRVNDQHGHVVGDRVLKMVARTLTASVRDGDTVVRWGGEEFLLLVTKADLSVLADLAERVRKLVEKAWVPLSGGEHLSVTVSVGGALVGPTEGSHEVVERADAMLFACKAAGRNCSRVEKDGQSSGGS
jgi:diguanylate cyclase (GGDEF)-like protein